jgi:hypothetical protein
VKRGTTSDAHGEERDVTIEEYQMSASVDYEEESLKIRRSLHVAGPARRHKTSDQNFVLTLNSRGKETSRL